MNFSSFRLGLFSTLFSLASVFSMSSCEVDEAAIAATEADELIEEADFADDEVIEERDGLGGPSDKSGKPRKPVGASIEIQCKGYKIKLSTGTGSGSCTTETFGGLSGGQCTSGGNGASGGCGIGCIESSGKGSCTIS